MVHVFGSELLARTLAQTRISDKYGNNWQYHPRSDQHGKVACWVVLFDLLDHCPLLARHVTDSKVGFGINHEMHDFRMNRKKKLDLVICRPGGGFRAHMFDHLQSSYGIVLSEEEERTLKGLPPMRQCPVGSVLVALEAKACMTEHMKARPRLYDELSSSCQTILGDTESAIAGGFVTINLSSTFLSPLRNSFDLAVVPARANTHDQPKASKSVFEKVKELPRRSQKGEAGFDALGVVLMDFRNDGSEVHVRPDFGDGTGLDPSFTYRRLVERISTLYSTRFAHL